MSSLEETLYECRKSSKVFAKTIFPDHFNRPFDPPHDEIFKVLDRPKISASVFRDKGLKQSKTAIASPRGTGKTTLVNLVLPAKAILFGTTRYIVMVGASQSAAVEQSETLKNELLDNENICTLFGDIKSEIFSQDRWDVIVGRTEYNKVGHHRVRILPIGPGGKIRGRKQGQYRPDLILIDDLENDENVESEEQRIKLERWLRTAVLNSIDRSKDWQIVLIGTILRHDALLAKLLNFDEYPGWNTLRLSICDEDYNTLWPAFMTTNEIKELVEEHRKSNSLSDFSREYMNQPVSSEDRKFRPEMWQHYNEEEKNLNARYDVKTMISIDPARTTGAGACRSAIVGVGVDCANHRLYVREVLTGKFSPTQLINEALAMADRLNAGALVVEVTGLNEYIQQPINNELALRRKPLTVFWIKPRDKKEKRAFALLPYYEQGRVRHNDVNCGKLEHRLEEWPKCSSWDEIDALSQVLVAMEQDEMYFYSDESPEEVEVAYTKLAEEDAVQGSNNAWRQY